MVKNKKKGDGDGEELGVPDRSEAGALTGDEPGGERELGLGAVPGAEALE